MEKVGVAYEIFMSKDKYTVDTFTFDLGRMVNTIEISKKFKYRERKERKAVLSEKLRTDVREIRTEKYRTIIINYIALVDDVIRFFDENPNTSAGLYVMIKIG